MPAVLSTKHLSILAGNLAGEGRRCVSAERAGRLSAPSQGNAVAIDVPLPVIPPRSDGRLDEPAMGDLRRRTAQGAVASFVFQASSLILRTGSMVILARMLAPEDFGLVGMVTAMTGFMALFKNRPLERHRQSATINDGSLDALLINVAIGSG